jgi:hypothetical protein
LRGKVQANVPAKDHPGSLCFRGGPGVQAGRGGKAYTEKRELFVRYHMELLAKKDPAKLKWIGDKYPHYVKNMGVLAR